MFYYWHCDDLNFSQFSWQASYIPVYANFETGAQNDPKMTCNTKRSKVLDIHMTTTHESQMSLRLAIWLVVFELQAILRKVHRMIQNENDIKH